MRISDEDRSLAAELLDLYFGDDREPWQERTLAIILMAHRQLPANEKPNAGAAQRVHEFVSCGARAPMAPQLRCLLPNHDGDHSAGSYTWE